MAALALAVSLLAEAVAAFFSPLPECHGELCVKPFIFHNFTNCPPVLELRSTEWTPYYRKDCPNEGTWQCANFTADWPSPSEGRVRSGSVDFSFADCCEHKNVRWAETVLRVRPDGPLIRRGAAVAPSDWEVRLHNLELRGSSGDVLIEDGTGRQEVCEGCYPFDACAGSLLPVSVTLNYTDSPNVTFGGCPASEACSMVTKVYLNGTLVHTSDRLVMDKFYSIQVLSLVIVIVKEMFELEDGNDELHLLSLWDIIPGDSFIRDRALRWRELTAADAHCVPQCRQECPEPEPWGAGSSYQTLWALALAPPLCLICAVCAVLLLAVYWRERNSHSIEKPLMKK